MKLKNKKGFTLIELLAVIVVLAIIALIATPIVMNTIKNVKKGAAERTADNYIKQVETAVAEAKLGNNSVPNGKYDIDEDGNLTGVGLPDGKLEIDMSGNKPTSGKITISNGGVSQDGTTMTVGDYKVAYNPSNNKYEATEIYKGVLCKAVTTATTGNVPEGNFAYGDEYTCELGDKDAKTFFVLETSDNNVSLIMNANVDSNGKAITPNNIPTDKGEVAWCSDATLCGDWDNTPTPLTAKNYLSTSTTSWTKLNQSQITLPTAYQISSASGKVFSSIGGNEISIWLYDYLDDRYNKEIKHSVSDIFGYWTATYEQSYVEYAFSVNLNGAITDNHILDNYGVRPVITVLKSNLS